MKNKMVKFSELDYGDQFVEVDGSQHIKVPLFDTIIIKTTTPKITYTQTKNNAISINVGGLDIGMSEYSYFVKRSTEVCKVKKRDRILF